MTTNTFTWIHKEYPNDSLKNLAKRVTEYHTACLFSTDSSVEYHYEGDGIEIGRLFLNPQAPKFTIEDIHVLNDLFNFNVYFTENTEDRTIANADTGEFDCLVSLASGDKVNTNPEDIGLKNGNHYVIDISPTAIHKALNIYKNISSFTQLDIFNPTAVKEFLNTCKGTRGLFTVSNCFLYVVSSLIYDVQLRLDLQNKFIQVLADDKIEWYVNMLGADGTNYSFVRAKDIVNKQLDTKFKILPWIA
jgi:hypothetical protein